MIIKQIFCPEWCLYFWNLYLSCSITGPDKFYIHPIGNENELLVVDRVSHTIGLETNTGQLAVEGMFGRQIQGILGIINLLAGPYLVVVTRSTKIGQICNQPVYRVEETDVISYTRNTLHLTEEQVNYNNSYLTMVKTVLRTPYFYFSYSYDLTHSLQRLYNFGPDFIKASLFERVCQSKFCLKLSRINHFLSFSVS